HVMRRAGPLQERLVSKLVCHNSLYADRFKAGRGELALALAHVVARDDPSAKQAAIDNAFLTTLRLSATPDMSRLIADVFLQVVGAVSQSTLMTSRARRPMSNIVEDVNTFLQRQKDLNP